MATKPSNPRKVSKRLGAQRLLKLADFLQTVPPKLFDFSSYISFGVDEDGRTWRPAQALKDPAHSCGTTCCALGYAPAAFPKLAKWKFGNGHSLGWSFALADGKTLVPVELSAALFGLDGKEHFFLFDPCGSRLDQKASAKQVAAHIRKFAKKRLRELDRARAKRVAA